MNNEEENAFLRDVVSNSNDDAVELQEILREGRRVMDEAEEVSNQMAARIRSNVLSPFKLKGLLGLSLATMVGVLGVRSAWRSYHNGSDYQGTGARNGRISKNALANNTSFLPKPASLVMDLMPSNSSYFLNTTNFDYDSILAKLLSEKLIFDICNAVPNERYYEKYIKPVFQEAISKATENSRNGLLNKRLFKRKAMESFSYLATFFREGTMINSPGLCDLKKYSINICGLLRKEFNDSNRYTFCNPHEVARSLSKEAMDASKLIKIDSLCNELREAVNSLIKVGCCVKFSPAAEILLDYARGVSSEIVILLSSDPLKKLMLENILNILNRLNERFYRESDTRGFWGEFTFHSIKNALTFDSIPSRDTQLYTQLLILHATIIPDFIKLRKHAVCEFTDMSILNSLLLDISKESELSVGDFYQNNTAAIPKVPKQAKIQHVDYKLPNITLPNATTIERNTTTTVPNATTIRPNRTTTLPNATTIQPNRTTTDLAQKKTTKKGFKDRVFFNLSTTQLPKTKLEVSGVGVGVGVGVGAIGLTADITAAALSALGVVGTFAISPVIPVMMQNLQGLITNAPTNMIPLNTIPNAPGHPQVNQPHDQLIEDWNIPGPSSRRVFAFPRISDELNLRVSNSRGTFMQYVNGNFGQMDISRMGQYRNSYFRYKLDVYGIRFREGYSIWEGLELNSVRDTLSVRSAQMTVAEHLDFVNAAIKRTLRLFEIILNNEDKNLSQIVMSYLVDYFRKTLNILDEIIITEVLFRLQEVAFRSSKYLQTLARNRFKNIWFVSSYGDVEQSFRQGDFITNLDSARIRSLPMFTTVYAGEVDDTIIAMFPEAAHPVNPEHPIPDFRYDSHHVGESLMHEITHASSTTEDYMYFERTLNGRAKNAKEMMEEFYKNLKNNLITDDLRNAINEYCRIYDKPIPTDLYAFFEENQRLKAYIIMNNAPSYETFFRDIGEVFPHDVDSWDSIVYSKVSNKNSLGQMDILNGAGPSGVRNLFR